MKAVVKVDIVNGKCVVIYSDGSEQELYEYPSDEGGGGGAVLGTKHITHNGEYNARSDNLDGYSSVSVAVTTPSPVLKVKEITSNGTYNAINDNADGYAKVIVDVAGGGDNYTVQLLERSLTGNFSVPTLTSIGAYALASCTGITSVNFPNLVRVKSNAFNGCSNLNEIHLPKATGDSDYVSNLFDGCSKLTTVVLPSWTASFYSNFFKGCSKLEKIDSKAKAISGSGVFNTNTVLDTLIIRRTSGICTLSNANQFNSTPFASSGTGGTLYVPSALISDYQNAAQWSTILGYTNNSIVAIEGSQYENYYADGTPIT